MAHKYLVDYRDIQFTLFEFLDVGAMSAHHRFQAFDRGVYEETLRLAEKIAVDEVFPANTEGHKEGCVGFKD